MAKPKTAIGLSADQRRAVADILNRNLSDVYTLYTKTRNYHWNVRGPRFDSLHQLFEDQYTQLAVAADEIAERARSLGFPALGTMAEFSKVASLKEQPGEYPDANTMVANLVADHETVIRALRNDVETCADEYSDAGTSDFLTGLMEAHEKMAWMLRASLER